MTVCCSSFNNNNKKKSEKCIGYAVHIHKLVIVNVSFNDLSIMPHSMCIFL